MPATVRLSAQDAWILLGAPSSCSIAVDTDLVVTWPGGSQDTLPAHTPAVASGGSTTCDTTTDVWLPYCQKGEGVLRMVVESLLATVDGPTVAMLARCINGRAIPYQPWTPGATTAATSGAWSGGALWVTSRAWSGGATAALIPVEVGNDDNLGYPDWRSSTGFFLKVPSAPASDMILLDYAGSGTGGTYYLRWVLQTDLTVRLEFTYHGHLLSVDLCAGAALTPLTWYWVDGWQQGNWTFDTMHGLGYVLKGQVTELGGTVVGGSGLKSSATVTQGGYGGIIEDDLISCTLGIGVNTSGGGYLAFPNHTGFKMSKLQQINQDGSHTYDAYFPQAAPTTDNSGGSSGFYEIIYFAEQTTGAATTLTDSSGNGRDATAGGGGLTIEADGPFSV